MAVIRVIGAGALAALMAEQRAHAPNDNIPSPREAGEGQGEGEFSPACLTAKRFIRKQRALLLRPHP